MPNTSERGEITARANAKEAETVRQSQKLTSKTKQLSALNNAKSRLRRARTLRVRPREPTAWRQSRRAMDAGDHPERSVRTHEDKRR